MTRNRRAAPGRTAVGYFMPFQNAEGGSHEGQGQQQRQQRADDGENHQQRQGNHEQQCGDEFRQAPGHMESQTDRLDEQPGKTKNNSVNILYNSFVQVRGQARACSLNL